MRQRSGMSPERKHHLDAAGVKVAIVPPGNEVERNAVSVMGDRVCFVSESATIDP
jgi:hypothetical protein